MTAEEKAKDLVDKFNFDLRPFSELGEWDSEVAKKCALIAVDEHLKGMSFTFGVIGYASLKFWQEVKQEIEKL